MLLPAGGGASNHWPHAPSRDPTYSAGHGPDAAAGEIPKSEAGGYVIAGAHASRDAGPRSIYTSQETSQRGRSWCCFARGCEVAYCYYYPPYVLWRIARILSYIHRS